MDRMDDLARGVDEPMLLCQEHRTASQDEEYPPVQAASYRNQEKTRRKRV